MYQVKQKQIICIKWKYIGSADVSNFRIKNYYRRRNTYFGKMVFRQSDIIKNTLNSYI